MIRRTAAILLVAGAAFASSLVLAQTKGQAPHHHHPKPKADAGVGGPQKPERGGRVSRRALRARTCAAKAVDAGTYESPTIDGGTRVFRFGEIEIEGRLRNPQLVYFLRRVRAEFSAGDLGHRTFMRELSDTRHDPNF